MAKNFNYMKQLFVSISLLGLCNYGGEFVSAFSGSKIPGPGRPGFHRLEFYKKRDTGLKFLDRNRNHLRCPRVQRDAPTRLKSAISSIPSSWYYLGLLAIQFGCQPLLTKKFTPKNIVKSTVVLAQDTMRFVLCLMMLIFTGAWSDSIGQWTLQSALIGAGIPSALYLVQNYCALMAYQNLPPVTFNILNQTKTLSAALCCYIVMGRRQSPLQIVSLLVLLLSALVLEKVVPISLKKNSWTKNDEEESSSRYTPPDLMMGVIPILVASFISGLGEFILHFSFEITTTVRANISCMTKIQPEHSLNEIYNFSSVILICLAWN